MATPSYGQGQGGAGAAHVWKREWVKGAPGTAPFPSQIGTPSPLAGAVTIVSGTVSQLPQPPNPLALSGSLGSVVNTVTGKQTLYMFNGVAWQPILATTASGSGGSGTVISNVTVAGGTGINVTGGPAYSVALQVPVTVPNGGTGVTSLTALSGTFVLLSPAAQQNGSINVNGAILGQNFQLTGTTAAAQMLTDGTNVLFRTYLSGASTFFFQNSTGGSNLASIDASGNIVANGTAQATVSGTLSLLPPMLNLSGTAKSKFAHMCQGNVTATGASTTITLPGAGAFVNAVSWAVFDATANAAAAVTATSLTAVTFTSINTHIYTITAIGD
jgi:hypothetical protein